MLVLVLLFSAWQHFELLRHGYEMQRLQRERASEEEVNRHLRLEIETLRSPRRIEEIAIKELHLVAPERDQAIVIERVTPSAPPEKSIVAGALRATLSSADRPRHAEGAPGGTVAEEQASSGSERDARGTRRGIAAACRRIPAHFRWRRDRSDRG